MTLGIEAVRQMLVYVCGQIVSAEPYLTEIDTMIGDGDHGANMKLGFSAAAATLTDGHFSSVNEVFKETGMALLKTMGGASGVLFGTILVGGLRSVPVSMDLDEAFFAQLMTGALQSLMRRSKARLGDKTMMDALIPAVDALNASVSRGEALPTVAAACAQAAKDGMENTRHMRSRVGRSKPFGDKTVGLPDAGAVSVSIFFGAISQWLHTYENIPHQHTGT